MLSWIYGLNPVLEAIRAGRHIKAISIYKGRHREILHIKKQAEIRDIPVLVVGLSFFQERFPKGHQGIAAQLKEKTYTPLDKLLNIPKERGEIPFFLILDGVEDPRNLGAILRVAEASGVHGVIIPKYRAGDIGPLSAKASAGAIEYIAVSQVSNIKNVISEMKKNGLLIIGAEGGSDLTPYDLEMTVPLSLVIGGEGKGLRETVKSKCDFVVSLPMRGKVNSLNVSVATGVLLYEILRQKLRKT